MKRLLRNFEKTTYYLETRIIFNLQEYLQWRPDFIVTQNVSLSSNTWQTQYGSRMLNEMDLSKKNSGQ